MLKSILAILLTGVLNVAAAQTPDTLFTRTDAMIPMRDGTHLFTVIMRPRAAAGALPFIMTRTPYGTEGRARGLSTGAYPDLVAEGYIFVFQDIRGLNRSEGKFVMNRPPRSAGAQTDESTDTYDTIEWLLRNVPDNNGRVGIFGISYPGWLTDQSLIDPHPALKAVSPQATMGDTWMGDDFFHQGAWRQAYGTEYSWMMEASTDQSVLPTPSRFDTYTWYLSFPTLDSLARAVGALSWPTWRRFVEHPAYDSAWQSRAVERYLKHTTVPTLTVGGVWDQEDIYGPQATYRAREAADREHKNFLVLGPWYHGQWGSARGDSLGNIAFGSPTGEVYRRDIEAPWFAYWLKGKGSGAFAEARVFDAGTRAWRSFDSWPPRTALARKLYFNAHGLLSFDAPRATVGVDTFVSDPQHPVPYRPRPVEWTYGPGSRWRRWLTEDQRFVEGRPDVLVWQTAPLTEPVTIAGNVMAHLFASTTGSDADWVVKLIDVYPDTAAALPMRGYQLMVNSEIMRGRYWKSFSTATPIPRNTIERFNVDLHDQAYTFQSGHRIMVQVQSTWFPLYDRNPQTFVPNIFKARAGDYRAQTHRIYRTAARASNVEVMVLPGDRTGSVR
ncbi:MAG TPA: CocE/NonD family hydrolase [Longimicrobiales bacterium]